MCPHCDGPLFKGKRIAVIGGGNSGVEAAIDLAGVVGHVTLIEFDDQAARGRSAAGQAALDGQCRDRYQWPDHRDPGAKGKVNGLLKDRASGDERTSNSKACSCRSAWCPTPNGSRTAVSN